MKYVLQLEYLGTNYSGWQRQKHLSNTLQEVIEKALSEVFAEKITTICAGRTDLGVHARQQVVDFIAHNYRSEYAALMGGNSLLPSDISIKKVSLTADLTFSARFSAKARHYKYFIINTKTKSPLQLNRALWCHMPLNLLKMREAAQHLLGAHDFSSFRNRDCQALNSVREIYLLEITQDGDVVCIDIKANAFLHSMVRKIVGTLLWVGEGRREPGWIKEVLEARDRSKSGPTVAPEGLYLWGVEY